MICSNCDREVEVEGLCVDCYEERVNQVIGMQVMKIFLETGHCPIFITKGEERPPVDRYNRHRRIVYLPDYWKKWRGE